ncbi:MAG: hypothetical protein WCS72_17750, partial [Deltaproteobacteria bacterium]
WLPPATGTLGLFVADPAKAHPTIAGLQDADGNWPFDDGSLVAWFRLLPEVEARLDEFMRMIPEATANGIAVPSALGAAATRQRIRSFALVPGLPSLSAADVLGLLLPEVTGSSEAEKLAFVGLALDGTSVKNGATPMTWLRRPGKFSVGGGSPEQDVLLQNLGGTFTLWAFDHRGRAVDPGAVACWWSWLLTTAIGSSDPRPLLPKGLSLDPDYGPLGGPARVCAFTDARTVHVVSAHEGPLGEPFLGGSNRLTVDGNALPGALVDASATTAVLGFSAAPSTPTPAPPGDNPVVDDAPIPRLAILPSGSFAPGPLPRLFPGSAVTAGLTRDYVRVAVVEEEQHLLGVARGDSRPSADDAETLRKAAQNRPSTRTLVSRTAGTASVLLATSNEVHGALLDVFGPDASTRAVLGLADAAGGRIPTGLASAAGAVSFPSALSADPSLSDAGTFRVSSLVGGGAAEQGQIVLLEVRLPAAAAGAWVRAWPAAFDLLEAVHYRSSGGGGRVDASGLARIALRLPPGRTDTDARLSADLLAATLGTDGKVVVRTWASVRFDRPTPATGPATALAATDDWVVCETGATGTGTPSGVPSGSTVVKLTGPAALVDRSTLPAAAWLDTLASRLGKAASPDLLDLTQPPYLAVPDHADPAGRPLPRSDLTGSPLGRLDLLPSTAVHRVDRSVATSATASSVPFVLQERLEIAAASLRASGPVAVVGSAPFLPWSHETLPSHLGHPGAPAAIEFHGTGVTLDGPPAGQVAEFLRERTAGMGFTDVRALTGVTRSLVIQSELALAAEAATAIPAGTASTEPGPVVAVLRTVATGMEGAPGGAEGARAAGLLPVSQNVAKLEAWLDRNLDLPVVGPVGTALRGAVGASTDSVVRALDRRLQVGDRGAREVATSLVAAFGRARDLVYVETPAVDLLAFDP